MQKGAVIALWRGLVWVVGSLSVAVLLRLVFGVRMAPVLQQALDAYDRGVSEALARVEPLIALLTGPLHTALGSGVLLYPHWTHVFLVALLHMLPRTEATYGVGGIAAGVVWCLQAVAAFVLAALVAAYVGAAPFLKVASGEGFFVGVFIASALCINVVSHFDVSDDPADQAQYEASDRWWSRWWTRTRIIDGFLVAFVLAIIGIGMIGLMAGRLDPRSAEVIVVGLGLLALVVILVRSFSSFFSPRDEFDDFMAANSLIMNVALFAMFLVLLPLADHLTPHGGVRPALYLMSLGAALIGAVHYFGRRLIGWLIGRAADAVAPPGTPALGVFIAGGAAVLFANVVVPWSP